jgi:hypothetical protein
MKTILDDIEEVNRRPPWPDQTYFKLSLEVAPRPSSKPRFRLDIYTRGGFDEYHVQPKFGAGDVGFNSGVDRIINLARRMSVPLVVEEEVVAVCHDNVNRDESYTMYNALQAARLNKP